MRDRGIEIPHWAHALRRQQSPTRSEAPDWSPSGSAFGYIEIPQFARLRPAPIEAEFESEIGCRRATSDPHSHALRAGGQRERENRD